MSEPTRKIAPQAMWPDPPPAPKLVPVKIRFRCESCNAAFTREDLWLPGAISEPQTMMLLTAARHDCETNVVGLARCVAIVLPEEGAKSEGP